MDIQLFHCFSSNSTFTDTIQYGYNYRCISREEKLKLFKSECRNHQTLYYNLEGPFNHITVYINSKSDSIKQIQDFIKNFTFLEYTINQLHKVELLSEVIYKEYYKYKEINLYILWVFCYEFELEDVKAYPVFKIIRNSGFADFFDSNGKKYSTWTNFLDNHRLPLGLICVPRNGKYEMENDFLCLEYFNTEQVRKKLQYQSSLYNFQPHVNKITNWLRKIYINLRAMPQKIVTSFSNLWSLIRPLGKKAMVVGVALFKVLLFIMECKTNKNLNIYDLRVDVAGFLRNGTNFDKEVKKVQDFLDSVKNIDILFQKVIKRNDISSWKELSMCIVKVLDPIFQTASMVLPVFFPSSHIIFNGFRILQHFLEPAKEILCKSQLSVELNSDISHDQPLLPHYREEYESKIMSENLVKEMHSDFLKPTKKEEKNSQNILLPEPKSIKINTLSPQGVENPFGSFYLFEQITFADVIKDLRKILGSDLKLTIKETYYFDVTNSKGDHLGEVFCAKNNVVMGLFKHEALINKDSVME